MENTSFARIVIFSTVIILIIVSIIIYGQYSQDIPKNDLNVTKLLPDEDPGEFLKDKELEHVARIIFIGAGIFFLVVICIYGFLKVLENRKKGV